MADPTKKYETIMKATITMGQLDYERYHNILTDLNDVAMSCRQYDMEFIMNNNGLLAWYSILKELYLCWKCIIVPTDILEFEGRFKDIKIKIMEFYKNSAKKKKTEDPEKIIDLLDKIHSKLLITKQRIGLGMNIAHDLTKKQKVAKALA